jgi:hypothetical protein
MARWGCSSSLCTPVLARGHFDGALQYKRSATNLLTLTALPVWSRTGVSIYIGESRLSELIFQGRLSAHNGPPRIELNALSA